MKTKAMITLLLLLICTMVFASEDAGDAAEHARKTRELNQLAERFKAETGFTGEVGHSSRTMRLHTYRGNFSDIPFTTEADTIAFRQACERIVDKILPISLANRIQLSMSRISKSVRGYTTRYEQQVGGYRVEGAGFIMITYEEGRKRFSIGDNTVELPDVDVSAIITLEEAIRIANLVYFKSSNPRVQPRKVTLEFTNGKNQNNKNYYLCYNLYMGTVVCVDAVTGDVRYTWSREKVYSGSVLIKGAVYEKEYVNHAPSPLGNLPLSGVLVSTDSFIGSTDDNGVVIIDESSLNGLSARLEEMPIFKVTVYPDSTTAKTADQYNLGSTPMEIYFSDDTCYSPNVYYHAAHQRAELESMFNSASDMIFGLAIVAGDTTQAHGGYFEPSYNMISLSNSAGKLSHAVRHEVSHCYVYETLGDYLNYHPSQGSSMDYWAMDEAFAVYLPCSVIEQPECIYGDSLEITSLLAVSNHTSSISTLYYGNANVDESLYSKYYFRYPLASAWWSLRSDPEYSPTAVDNLLIAGLKRVSEEIIPNVSYRYKPRYFYNILMDLVDDVSDPERKRQNAINKAYESRGFHFSPKVESYSEGNRSRNVFSPGDQVHAKITKAPQNTAFTVYVIRHGDYTYLDGANVSSLTPHYATGFSNPITGNSTDAGGNWDGLVWAIPTEAGNVDGGYDIIVDFGSPEAPDNQIHFTYTAANVMDGIDGLHKPGFTVVDDRIDVLTLASELNASPLSR